MQEFQDENRITYTKDEFLPIFNKIKDCIRFGRYSIELNDNRSENQEFINTYNLADKRIRQILNNLKIEDFCYATRHIKEHDILLYVFAPSTKVYEIQKNEINIDMYIKIRIYDSSNNPAFVVAISFHKLNENISYLFK